MPPHIPPTPPSAPPPVNLLYVVVGGHVVALFPATGAEVWRTKIKNALSGIVSLAAKDGLVFAGVAGVVHCLDGLSGTILWTNELKGLGYGHVYLAMEGVVPDSAGFAAAIEQQRSSD